MEHLADLTLVNKNREEVSADEVLNDKEFVGFYFTEAYENCLEFEPLMAKSYNEAKENNLPLEIIYISNGKSEEEFYERLNNCHADWLAIPFGSPVINKLGKQFDAGCIPHVAVIKKDDGTLVSTGGICCVKALGSVALPKWCYQGSGTFFSPNESEEDPQDSEEKGAIEAFSMEDIAGLTLVRKNKEEVSLDEALKDKEFILFYFSAHWCSPCRKFTPVLAECYEEAKEKEFPLEIIFVSSDRSEEEFNKYMNESHGDWLAVPFGSPAIELIREKFNNKWLPEFEIVKTDGTLVPTGSRIDIEEKGFAAIEECCAEFTANEAQDKD